MAGTLGHSWNSDLWNRAAKIMVDGPSLLLAETAPSPPRPRQQQTRLTPAQATELLADYAAGASIASLAASHHVDKKTATKHLTDNGITIRPNKVAIPASEHQQLLELQATGLSHGQIAAHYGCSRQAVQQALQRAIRTQRERD